MYNVYGRGAVKPRFGLYNLPNLLRKCFDNYDAIPIGQRHMTVSNGYRIQVIWIGTVRLQIRITD